MKTNTLKTKRIKQVFSSSQEVFHLWANQSQEYARQGGRITRAFFEGESCYSYGRHYEVGRLAKINGVTVALINRTGYSHTTSKHISEASSAVSHLPQIDVDGSFDWKRGLLGMQDALINSFFDQLKRRAFWKEHKVFDKYKQEELQEFNNLCSIVGMKKLQLFPDKETISLIQEHVNYRIQRKTTLDNTKNERLIKRYAQQIEAWKNGGEFTNAVSKLRPQIIRIKNNEVQTSSRATVTLSEAKDALRVMSRQATEYGKREVEDYHLLKVPGKYTYHSSVDRQRFGQRIYFSCDVSGKVSTR